jgi:hypothetical protein
MFVKVLLTLVVIAALAAFIWSTDRITFQGERTVYTVTCDGGAWVDNHCTNKLAAGARYTFRASRSRQEVLYWIVGSNTPSGRYGNCRVENRGNWSCTVESEQPRTIAVEMRNDKPIRISDGSPQALYTVPKWKWWAIKYGLNRFTDAGT